MKQDFSFPDTSVPLNSSVDYNVYYGLRNLKKYLGSYKFLILILFISFIIIFYINTIYTQYPLFREALEEMLIYLKINYYTRTMILSKLPLEIKLSQLPTFEFGLIITSLFLIFLGSLLKTKMMISSIKIIRIVLQVYKFIVIVTCIPYLILGIAILIEHILAVLLFILLYASIVLFTIYFLSKLIEFLQGTEMLAKRRTNLPPNPAIFTKYFLIIIAVFGIALYISFQYSFFYDVFSLAQEIEEASSLRPFFFSLMPRIQLLFSYIILLSGYILYLVFDFPKFMAEEHKNTNQTYQ